MVASEKEIDAFLNQYLKVDDRKKEEKEQIKELMKKDNRILSNAIKIYKEPRTSGTNIEQQNKINETVTTTLLRGQKILQELQIYLKNQNKVFEEQQKYDIEMLKKASTKNDNKEIGKIQEKMIKNLNKNTLQNLIIMTISSIMYPDNLSRYCDYYYNEGAEAYRLLVMQEIMNNFQEYKNLIKNIDKNCKISLKISNIGMYLDNFINNILSPQQIGKNLFNLEKGDFIEAILNVFVWKIIEQDKKGYYMNNEFNDYKNFIKKYYNVQTKYKNNVLQCINNATGFVAKTINILEDNNLKEILKNTKTIKMIFYSINKIIH